MSYLNLDLDYFSHPKVVRLVGLLGRGASELPIKLWCYCGKYHAESGNLESYSAQEIESAVGWWGKTGEMVEAMVKVGLLIASGDGYTVKDWLDHQGHLVAFKIRAQAGAKARWNNISNASSNAKDDAKQCPIPTIPTIPTKPTKTKKTIAGTSPAKPIAKKDGNPDYQIAVNHLMTTWKYKGGNYMFKKADGRTIKRLLQYGLPKCLALLDLFWETCDEWTAKTGPGKNLFGLMHNITKLMDNPRLAYYEAKHTPKAQEMPKIAFQGMPVVKSEQSKKLEILNQLQEVAKSGV